MSVTSVHGVLMRAGFLLYALGTSALYLVGTNAASLQRWTVAHGLVPAAVYQLIMTGLLSFCGGALVMISLSAWDALEVRMRSSTLSAGAARLRAYGFALLIIALAILPIHLATRS